MNSFTETLQREKAYCRYIFVHLFNAVFYTAVVNAWFYANRSSIAQKSCINKSRPKLKCNGNCYLNKQLKKAEENQENQSPKQFKKIAETSPFTLSAINYTLNSPIDISVLNPKKEDSYHFIPYSVIFHPPSPVFS
jgi:hypothetical protein